MDAILQNEKGSALVVALLMLVVLTLLGIAATTTSTIETQISSNDKIYKSTFIAADAGTEITAELLEQNIEARDWAKDSIKGNVKIGTALDGTTGNMYMNRESDLAVDDDKNPTDTNRDAVFPATWPADATAAGTNLAHTNARVVGNTRLSTGSAVQMAAGYEGKGKAAAGGGAWIIYDIRSKHQKPKQNSNAQVHLQWRHVL
jgi:Tfp pilus assembly protein PilX